MSSHRWLRYLIPFAISATFAAPLPSQSHALSDLFPSEPLKKKDLHVGQQWFRIQTGQVIDAHRNGADVRIWIFKALPLEMDTNNEPTDQIDQDLTEIPLFLQAYLQTGQTWHMAGTLKALRDSGLSSASSPFSIVLNAPHSLILSSTDGATGQGIDLQVMDFWQLDLNLQRFQELPSIAIASDNAGAIHPTYDLHAASMGLTLESGQLIAHLRWQGTWPESLRLGPAIQDCSYHLQAHAWKSQQSRCNAIEQFIRP